MIRHKWLVSVLLLNILPACHGPISLFSDPPTPPASATPTAAVILNPTATATDTATPTTTFTPIPSPSPTAIPSATASPTPTVTPTPQPSHTATTTPVPFTPTPTKTPTPAVDFRIASWRLWPLKLNSGCAQGMHTIFIHVLDASGAPLDGIVVGDSWNNVENVTGHKGPGRTEIDLWSNTMEIVVKREAATGQTFTSEVSFPFSSFMTTIPNELMIEAGYCANELECDWKREHESYYCGGHYSWEVIFQKTH